MPFHPTIASDSGRLLPRRRRRRLAKVAGKVAGNTRVEAQGDVEQIAGKIQNVRRSKKRSHKITWPGAVPSRGGTLSEGNSMNRLIYIVGLVVVVLAVLWFFGLR